ncbi:hypothetical protein ACFSTA_04845 [Ornithinibacillus salinisoli]|uniref:DUF3139 domain-containing protein n=1 Tax=Ornithinibacillus salinisoli TaxID=1848459 RepID=A0ABW4VWS4_9BACI
MKILLSVFMIILMLAACSDSPLVEDDFHEMQVFVQEEIVFETTDQSVIDDIIKEINTSRRDTTHELELPTPDGEIIFINESETLSMDVYEDGGVSFDEYYVHTEFDYVGDHPET